MGLKAFLKVVHFNIEKLTISTVPLNYITSSNYEISNYEI